MSYVTPGILSVIAVCASLGAVELASGHDLGGVLTLASKRAPDVAASANIGGVNREAKGDRGTLATRATGGDRTISLTLGGVQDTSILVRVPAKVSIIDVPMAGTTSKAEQPARTLLKPVQSVRRTVACEAPVSVLTDVARQLEPGRCVT